MPCGGERSDNVNRAGGPDIIEDAGGRNCVRGGNGHDIVSAGANADIISRDSRDDRADGDANNDVLLGVEGSGAVGAGNGDDTLLGQLGEEDFFSGEGTIRRSAIQQR